MRITKIAPAMPFSGKPKINLASVFGASPNKPFLLRIPVTGQRPIVYGAVNLPEGLELRDNIITGAVCQEGNYEVTLTAENDLGKTEKKLLLEIKPGNVLVTPLLGFTTWNAFAGRVSQDYILDTAHKMVDLGITEYGYRYMNTDSGWQGVYGGEFDAILPNKKFPNIKAMTDELHSLGFKCGIYSTPMLNAWGYPEGWDPLPGCTVGEPDKRFAETNGGIGVIHKEKNNAKQWEQWGFDYLKYDWRPADPVNAELMREELMKTGRDFGFCVTVEALTVYCSYWSKFCNSYRNNEDCLGYWDRQMEIYRTYFDHMAYMNKGHYFDLDMLDVGKCVFTNKEGFYNEDEQIVVYSMRAFLNSPIQISSVLDDVSEFEMALLCNEEIIAINQDAAFETAIPVLRYQKDDSVLDVFEKKLEDGSYAYAIFNMGQKEERVSSAFAEEAMLRDVWAKEDLGRFASLELTMAPHTVRILKSSSKLSTAEVK